MPRNSREIESLLNRVDKSLGGEFSFRGSKQRITEPSIPTGSLELDLKLGTGGWPRGCIIGVFGPRDIGKSTVIGLNAIANAQKMDLGCALVTPEQKWDPEWARRFGVDPDEVLVVAPDTGEKSFKALQLIVSDPAVDLVIFDSIGAILSHTEMYGTDNSDAKAKQGGQSGLITWGMKLLPFPVISGQKVVIMLNQVRHIMSTHGPGGYQQPGGEALEHFEEIIVQLKNGDIKQRETFKDGGDDIVYGQEIAAVIIRNQRSEGTRKVARFKFYNMDHDNATVGIDKVDDLVRAGSKLGVIGIPSKGWFTLPGETKNLRKKEIAERLEADPTLYDSLRTQILEKM